MEPADQLAVIIPTLIDIVDGVSADQLTAPTPCANFTVNGVLDHMMGGAAAFVPAFLGEESGDETTASATSPRSPEVPAAAFRAAMNGLLGSVNAPGAMERMIDAPFGRVPGSVFARFVAFDGLIHGWDLSIATGRANWSTSWPSADAPSDGVVPGELGVDHTDGDDWCRTPIVTRRCRWGSTGRRRSSRYAGAVRVRAVRTTRPRWTTARSRRCATNAARGAVRRGVAPS